MSGRINLSNLSDSLKEHLNGLGLTEEQVNAIVQEAIAVVNAKDLSQDEAMGIIQSAVNKAQGEVDAVELEVDDLQTFQANHSHDAFQEKIDENLVTDDKTIVGAINELFQNANNGKQIIADAIGSPLSSADTFAAMGSSIDSLTVDFRNALALKGVNAPADKFETLISRISEIVQSGNVLNNIATAKGTYTLTSPLGDSYSGSVNIPINTNFTPVYVVANVQNFAKFANLTQDIATKSVTVSTDDPTGQIYVFGHSSPKGTVSISNYTSSSFKFTASLSQLYIPTGSKIKWYVVGSTQLPNNGGQRNITPSTTDQVLPYGYYSGNITVAGDADLVAANIVSGKNIFGVDGSATVSSLGGVTPAGTAVAGDVVSGKTFINSTGQLVTGTMVLQQYTTPVIETLVQTQIRQSMTNLYGLNTLYTFNIPETARYYVDFRMLNEVYEMDDITLQIAVDGVVQYNLAKRSWSLGQGSFYATKGQVMTFQGINNTPYTYGPDCIMTITRKSVYLA